MCVRICKIKASPEKYPHIMFYCNPIKAKNFYIFLLEKFMTKFLKTISYYEM